METKCHNCGYEWDYSGSKTNTATCPDCKSSTPLEDAQADTDANENNGGGSSSDSPEHSTANQSTAKQSNEQATTVQHPLTGEQVSLSDALDDVVDLFYTEHNSVAERVGDVQERVDDLEEQTDNHREMIIELSEAVEALGSHQHDLAEGQPTDGQTVTLEKDLRD